MKFFNSHIFLTVCFALVCSMHVYAQKEKFSIKGNIFNYRKQPLYLYQCYGDTLFLSDSIQSDENGTFSFANFQLSGSYSELKKKSCLLKIVLQQNQFFYLIYNGKSIEIKTAFEPNAFFNIATDSLVVLESEENKLFYQFQGIQRQINIANQWLLQMMRLYPLSDPFHRQIEDAYMKRFSDMEQLVLESSNKYEQLNSAFLIAKAYYQPVLPDWKQPDFWRDSILAFHYFDYFNPADPFYLNTNILPEKIDLYLKLYVNKENKYGQPVVNEKQIAMAAQIFLEKTKVNNENFDFCLNYLLKKFSKERLDEAFLFVYDENAKQQTDHCDAGIVSQWVKERVDELRHIVINGMAPDFKIADNLNLSGIQSEYTLLLFWASWCSHCTEELPKIKEAVIKFNEATNSQKLITLAVSLDTDKEQWQNYVSNNRLFSFLNFSELKGWQSEVVKKYNVFATPTMFLLDKNKKIIAKPLDSQQLLSIVNKIADLR